MGLDWCVSVYENRDEWSKDKGDYKNEKLKVKLNKMRDELIKEHKITLYYRGKIVAHLLRDLETEDEDASNLCYGEDVFDNDGEERGPFLTDYQIENIIESLEFIKTNNKYMKQIIDKKNSFETKEEIIDECDDAINFLEKVRDYDGDYFVNIWCWY